MHTVISLNEEQQIEILENEIKLIEEKIYFYNKSPFFKDPLKQAGDISKYYKKIEEKNHSIHNAKRRIKDRK